MAMAPCGPPQPRNAALLGALVEWARTTGTKVVPLCPFAKAQFGKDASIRDVLA